MMRRIAVMILPVLLCLCGCSDMFSGYYYYEEPHLHGTAVSSSAYAVEDSQDMCGAFSKTIAAFDTEMMLVAETLDQETLEQELRQAYLDTLERDPLAAYAVGGISSRTGQMDGKSVATVTIEYLYDEKQLSDIKTVGDMEEATEAIRSALSLFDEMLVLYVERYEELDVAQTVQELVSLWPDQIMEKPRVITAVYPYTGQARVLEICFSYTIDRAALKRMKETVAQSFLEVQESVPEGLSDRERYEWLWSFLKERSTGCYDSSVTPAYSLLRYGVGDSAAHAQVYAALCARMGLECQILRGTRDGQGHCWVMVRTEEGYRHLELLSEEFRLCTDDRMEGYVWDFAAYPACSGGG